MNESEYSIDVEELKKRLGFYTKNIENNTTIVTPDDLGYNFLYHISFKPFKELVPNISRRSALSEDNTVPRVHVSDTIGNCILGHSSIGYVGANTKIVSTKKGKKEDSYLGGFYIHQIPFRASLKPNEKLVFDAKVTNEHWLVTYNEMTRVFPALNIGKGIVKEVKYLPRANKYPEEIITLVIEYTGLDKLIISKDIAVKKGYWEVSLNNTTGKVNSCGAITKHEFLSTKQRSAAMLSIDEEPRFLF
jgi:hypothetical protein